MKKLLKMFFKEIYETFISPHILLAIFILVFYLSHVFYQIIMVDYPC